ncbi:MAG: hypothetical protein KJ659_09210 [Actinobacteria bacterium]|nr:hypothetical protein [Actinomycetota bacterium]MBU1609677.1 hypothetical protein [Actinomycetota bacterium]MBU2316182.1 hypothetical protein [Actinomycetota bacterium]MBU2385658.1 hypothetical protein [Actinomycetota bacterium]
MADRPHADRSCNIVETITVTDMAGDQSEVQHRLAVLEALRAVHDAGTRIGWLTSWLTVPDRLAELADQLDLRFVEFPPDIAYLQPENVGIDPKYGFGHWKTRAVRDHAQARGDRLLWIDDQVQLRFAHELPDSITFISPSSSFGLERSGVARMRRWAAGEQVESLTQW